MATQEHKTFSLFLSVCVSGYARGKYSLNDFDRSPFSSEWRVVSKIDVPVVIPQLDLDTLEIEGLEAALQKDRAESQSRQNILLDRISKLKAIGHDGADDVVLAAFGMDRSDLQEPAQ
jgi:hypothetical protein